MFTALHLCSAAGSRQCDFHVVKSSLADIALKVKTDLVLQPCQHFKALLDEDGLKQLDERLAHYTAAQVMGLQECCHHNYVFVCVALAVL